MTRFLFYILFAILFFPHTIKAQQQIQLSDSAQISILTHSPWEGAIYSLFGHAAIRVQDFKQDIDLVFNYGIFNFHKPNFIYRFAKGETDYMVAATEFNNYAFEYRMRGQSIREQVIRLSKKEQEKIWQFLCRNILPQNREYRYNFFFDNCATRPFQILKHNIQNPITIPPSGTPLSFREIVNECLRSSPWVKFGINIVLGSKADQVASEEEKTFLPKYLHDAIAKAEIEAPDGSKHRLELSDQTIAPPDPQTSHTPRNSPLLIGIALYICIIIVTILEIKNNKKHHIGKITDILLFTLAGIAGSILTFLMFASVHPCMSPNWNYAWLHPFHLLAVAATFTKPSSNWQYYYHFITFAVLTLFGAISLWLPQSFLWAFSPYILMLWTRSGSHMVFHIRNKHQIG